MVCAAVGDDASANATIPAAQTDARKARRDDDHMIDSCHRWRLAPYSRYVLDVSRTSDSGDSRNIIFCGSTDHSRWVAWHGSPIQPGLHSERKFREQLSAAKFRPRTRYQRSFPLTSRPRSCEQAG